MSKHTPETQEEEQTQALQNLDWDRDAVPFLDEDGGRLQLGVDIIEIDEGAVASGDIDISGASASLQKAGSGTGSYSTSGVTQPSLTKSDGRVEVDEDLVDSEWTAGDGWRLVISGVKADDTEGNTYNLPDFTWSGGIGDWGEIKADLDTVDSNLGSPSDAAVDPSGTSGGLHAKMRGLANDVGDATADASLTSLTAKLGDDGDSASVGSGSLHARIQALEAALGIVSSGAGGGFEADGTPSLHDRMIGDSDALLTRVGDPTGGTDANLAARLGDPSGSPTASASGNLAERLEEIIANRLTSARAGNLDNVDYQSNAPTTGSHSQDGTTENDVVVFDSNNEGAINGPTELTILLNLENLTENADVRVYEKIDDGSGTVGFKSVDPVKNWTTSDENAIRIDFIAQDDVKITMQQSTDESSARTVPWKYSLRDMTT